MATATNVFGYHPPGMTSALCTEAGEQRARAWETLIRSRGYSGAINLYNADGSKMNPMIRVVPKTCDCRTHPAGRTVSPPNFGNSHSLAHVDISKPVHERYRNIYVSPSMRRFMEQESDNDNEEQDD